MLDVNRVIQVMRKVDVEKAVEFTKIECGDSFFEDADYYLANSIYSFEDIPVYQIDLLEDIELQLQQIGMTKAEFADNLIAELTGKKLWEVFKIDVVNKKKNMFDNLEDGKVYSIKNKSDFPIDQNELNQEKLDEYYENREITEID